MEAVRCVFPATGWLLTGRAMETPAGSDAEGAVQASADVGAALSATPGSLSQRTESA